MALVTAGLLAGVVIGTGVVPVTGPVEAAPVEPDVAQIGGDRPPMELTPESSAVASSSRTSSVRPVVTPPPHSNPVVTPETGEPPVSVVATTVMPSVSLPTLSSVSPPSSVVPSSDADVPVP